MGTEEVEDQTTDGGEKGIVDGFELWMVPGSCTAAFTRESLSVDK